MTDYTFADLKVKPNLNLAIAWLCSFTIIFGTFSKPQFAFICLSYLLFGWSFTYGIFTVREKEK